eukprot:CAMPEP_0197853884 /NCGR_PEP_ID=MMETSP1438-20131217/23606_1 /TAXON_ID=1461541 /ORGANISM="Pterosperma sp., Strain CCMP1384" /LENGTH=84 /DNA_ID=CAMNT_0043468453 /DNA_START=131 /DNA_END=385 /DNA_ORIENTATION=-
MKGNLYRSRSEIDAEDVPEVVGLTGLSVLKAAGEAPLGYDNIKETTSMRADIENGAGAAITNPLSPRTANPLTYPLDASYLKLV